MRQVTAAAQQPKRSFSTAHAVQGRHVNTPDHTSNSRDPTATNEDTSAFKTEKKLPSSKRTSMTRLPTLGAPSQGSSRRNAPLRRRQPVGKTERAEGAHPSGTALPDAWQPRLGRACAHQATHSATCAGRDGAGDAAVGRAGQAGGTREWGARTDFSTPTSTQTHPRARETPPAAGASAGRSGHQQPGQVHGGARNWWLPPPARTAACCAGGVLDAERRLGAAGGRRWACRRRRSGGHKPGGLLAKAPTAPYWILQSSVQATAPTERHSVRTSVAEQAPNRRQSVVLLFGAELWISCCF